MEQAEQMEELENLRKQHELLKKMLEQQHQLRALQGRQEALMAMQESAEQAIAAIEDTGEKRSDGDGGLGGFFLLQSSITMSALKQRAQLDIDAYSFIVSRHRNHRQRFRPEHHVRAERRVK